MAKWKELPADVVNHPPQYNSGGIECIDAMRAMSEGSYVEPHHAYCWQNAFKYIWRAHTHKAGREENTRKAIWFLRMSIGDDPRE